MKKTFDNFICDKRLKEIVDELIDLQYCPWASCSPVVLYGKNGVGKSHLCEAIQYEWADVAIYTSEEIFDLLKKVAKNTLSEDEFFDTFRDRHIILEDIYSIMFHDTYLNNDEEHFLLTCETVQCMITSLIIHQMENGFFTFLIFDEAFLSEKFIDELKQLFAFGEVFHIPAPDRETRVYYCRNKLLEDRINLTKEEAGYFVDAWGPTIPRINAAIKTVIAKRDLRKKGGEFMKAIITKSDGTTISHTIDFENNELLDFSFDEEDMKCENLADILQDITYLSCIPFIRFASKACTDMDQVKAMKKLFIKGMGELLEEAMKDEAPIGDTLRAKKESELYGFMEELYHDWLKEIHFSTDTLRHDFKDYRFVKLVTTVDEFWYTLEMLFINEDGDKRQLPMKLFPDYETATDEEIKQHSLFCLLIAVVVLDRLGYDPNPLREMNDPSAFEEEQLRIVRDYLSQQ